MADGRIGLVEEAGLLVGDALEEGLELEPAGEVRAYEAVSAFGRGVGNFMGLAGGFGEQLGLAGAFHGDEPPCGLVDRVADSEQAVIAEDGGLLRTEGASDAVAFGSFFDNPRIVVEDGVIFIKRASILRERIERATRTAPGFAVQ